MTLDATTHTTKVTSLGSGSYKIDITSKAGTKFEKVPYVTFPIIATSSFAGGNMKITEAIGKVDNKSYQAKDRSFTLVNDIELSFYNQPKNMLIGTNQTVRCSASPTNLGSDVTWSSSNPDVASIDSTVKLQL